jgi:hypothetical protein
MSDFAGLSIEGRLATPDDADWDAARAAWNLAVDQLPWAVAFVEGPADVAQVIGHARANGLSVTACIASQAEGEELIAPLPDEAIETFVATAGPTAGSPLLLAELRHAGGALARAPEDAGALAKLDAAFVMLGIGVPATPELDARVNGHLDHLDEQMKPWSSEDGYFNFAERPCDVDAILPAETCARLRDVKRRWDPDGIVRANHALSVA